MIRPRPEDFKAEYTKGIAEIASARKQYSKAQDLYIDYLENMKKETSPFKEYELYVYDKDKIIDVNQRAFDFEDEAFDLFKELFDTIYGAIYENGNLISIHTGGWSDNEHLISQFRLTGWWLNHHKITASGGHYYFNTDIDAEKHWRITESK